MATLLTLSWHHYQPYTDEYVLPGGRAVSGLEVRAAKQKARDAADAAKGYDPYNHNGMALI